MTSLAVAARWVSLPQSMALGDSLGPWLVAARGPWSTAPHAPPYGWLLAVPHAAILRFAPDLYSAFAAIRVVDALVAPLGAWAAYRLSQRWWSALCVGGLLAVDPSLLDTATSGAETYQAPVALAALTLAVSSPRARWSPWLAAGAFCWGVMAHPLAVLAAPLLVCVRWRPVPLVAGLVALVPHLVGLARQAGSAIGPVPTDSTAAVAAWVTQSGPAAALFALSAAGLVGSARHRRLGAATGLSVLLMLLTGARIGYLRDHHLRVFSAPLAVGLSGVPGGIAVLAAGGLLRWPTPDDRPAAHRRPGTLGLLHLAGTEVMAAHAPGRPLVIDGLRTVHTPAIEPGGMWLDLHLRGLPAHALDVTENSQLIVVLTAPRSSEVLESPAPFGLRRLAGRDTWALWHGTPASVSTWSTQLCEDRERSAEALPRVGGAWDGLALFHPQRGAAAVSGWWACQHIDTPPEGAG